MYYIAVLSLAVWLAKLEKKNPIKQGILNMTQIASLLVVATVFAWFMICNVQSGGGGAYTRDTLQELEP